MDLGRVAADNRNLSYVPQLSLKVLASLKTLNASLLEVKSSVTQIELLANSDGADIDPETLASLAATASAVKAPQPKAGERENNLQHILEKLLVRVLSRPNIIQEVWDDSLLDDLREVFDDDYLQELLESAPSDNEKASDNGNQQQSASDLEPSDSDGAEEDDPETVPEKPKPKPKKQPKAANSVETAKPPDKDEGLSADEKIARQDTDEWADDDDVGFVWMSVTEEEFFQLQEVRC